MRSRLIAAAALAILVLAAGCTDTEPACDAAGVSSALAAANPGDTVDIGACAITTSLTVPPGVTLSGAGPEFTTITGDSEVVIRLMPGAGMATTVVGMTVVSGTAQVGLLATGAGDVLLQDVNVETTRGYAVGIETATSATLTNVVLEGPVNESNADGEAFVTPDSNTTATYGLVLLGADRAELTNLTVRGFAQFGVVVLDRASDGTATAGTALTWTGGGVSETLGTNLYVSGGTATLTGVDLTSTFRGLRGSPTYGGVLTGLSTVTTNSLRVADNADYGLLQESGTATHSDVEVLNNATGGMLVGNASSFDLGGASSRLSGNGAANLLVLNSSNVSVRDATISDSLEFTSNLRAGGVGGRVTIGDGVQLIGSYDAVSLSDVTIENNERVGLLVDLGAAGGTGITFTAVTVRGEGAQLGAVAGTTDSPAEPTQLTPALPDGVWDSGIFREGDVVANDASWATVLDVAGIVSPSMLPRPTGAAGIVSPSM